MKENAEAKKCVLCSYYLNTKGVDGVCKRPALWGEIEKIDNDGKSLFHSPLVYLQKPKWIDDETFIKIISSISLYLPKGISFNKP
jgi:hypothetical protein